MNRPFELDVQDVKLKILNLARKKNIKPAVMVAAVADVIGHAAAMLERDDGMPFEDRTGVFIERAKATYTMTREQLARIARLG